MRSPVVGAQTRVGFVSAYVASKHGVVGLTRALAAELGSQGHHGITVNAICPGYVRAGMGVAVQSTKAGPVAGTEIFDRYYKRQVPLRRMIEPDEIGHAAVFLALPEATSADLAPRLLERGLRVVDLSGAFRLRERREIREHRARITMQDLLARFGADLRVGERLRGPLAAELGAVGAAHDAVCTVQIDGSLDRPRPEGIAIHIHL